MAVPAAIAPRYFNTKKVRLKPGPGCAELSPAAPFQYQKGAIKTRLARSSARSDGDFNTKKVRLKPLGRHLTERTDDNFNTKKVRLKPAW